MTVDEITFGIELETTMPLSYRPHVGAYHGNLPAFGLPEGWLAMGDRSIRTYSRTRIGCEFVSPVLQGAAGVRSILAAVAAIKSMGGRVNHSTGVHVHVGFDRRNQRGLDRLITLVANFEKAIYASTGTKSREGGHWSASVQVLGDARRARNADRYRVLNLTNLTMGRKPTVEFRAFAGTLNVDKILGHVRMCVGLVERALSAGRVTDWTARPVKASSPIHRNGEGQTTLTRLYYQLGWTKGRQPHTFGDLHCDGAPSIKDTKRTLMKLARKYDAQS